VASSYGLYDENLISELIKRGHELHVVMLKPRPFKPEEKIEGAVYWEISAAFGKLTRKYPLLLYPYHYLRVFLTLKKVLRDVKPHVLHGGNVQTAGLLCALTNYHPFLLMPFGSDILIYPKESKAIEWITKYTIAHSDLIMCDAKSVKEEIISLTNYGKEKISIIALGVNLNLFSSQVESDMKDRLGWKNNLVVICTRNHKKVYGIEYLLDAILQVIQNNHTVRFLMVGTGPLTEEFVKKVREWQIEDYVRFVGYIPNIELPKYLVASDIYVSPSLSDGASASLLEAMGCGLPAVVTDVPANREWIKNGENGYIVPRRDSKLLSEFIISLCQDNEAREIFGQRNYEIIQKQANLENNIVNLEEMYQELIRLTSTISPRSWSR